MRRGSIRRPKLFRSTTVPLSVRAFLKDQLSASTKKFDVVVGTNLSDDSNIGSDNPPYRVKHFAFTRTLTPINDLIVLLRLWRFLRSEKVDITHSITPKAGLITAIAAYLARIPVRMHTFTGQVWNEPGAKQRLLLKAIDRLISTLATDVYTDSQSQRELIVAEKIVSAKKIKVLGEGSVSGVDLGKFDYSLREAPRVLQLRKELCICKKDFVLGFVGRLTPEKGLVELLNAFRQLEGRYNVKLVLVGDLDDVRSKLPSDTINQIQASRNIFKIGFTDRPEQYIALFDLLCLPSYREGFGTVVIEAAAMKVPTVGTRVTGLTDAIIDGETGILVDPRNAEALCKAIVSVIDDRSLLESYSTNAYIRAKQSFDQRHITDLVIDEYERVLDSRPAIRHAS